MGTRLLSRVQQPELRSRVHIRRIINTRLLSLHGPATSGPDHPVSATLCSEVHVLHGWMEKWKPGTFLPSGPALRAGPLSKDVREVK